MQNNIFGEGEDSKLKMGVGGCRILLGQSGIIIDIKYYVPNIYGIIASVKYVHKYNIHGVIGRY